MKPEIQNQLINIVSKTPSQNVMTQKHIQAWLKALEQAQYESRVQYEKQPDSKDNARISAPEQDNANKINNRLSTNRAVSSDHSAVVQAKAMQHTGQQPDQTPPYLAILQHAQNIQLGTYSPIINFARFGAGINQVSSGTQKLPMQFVQTQVLPYSVNLIKTESGLRVFVRDYRQKGLGKALLQQLKHTLSTAGATLASLTVNGEEIYVRDRISDMQENTNKDKSNLFKVI